MQIIGAIWKPDASCVLLECDCGRVFETPADRKRVTCACGRQGHLEVIREKLMLANGVREPVAA